MGVDAVLLEVAEKQRGYPVAHHSLLREHGLLDVVVGRGHVLEAEDDLLGVFGGVYLLLVAVEKQLTSDYFRICLCHKGLLFAEIPDRIFEQRLLKLLGDVLEQVVLEALGMSHLSEYLSVGADDSLDGEAGAVGVPW